DLELGGGEFGAVLLQIAIGAHDVLESGHQQIENLFLVGIDDETATEEHHLDAHAQLAAGAQTAAFEHGVQALQQLFGPVGLGDEIVRAAFKPADDIHGIAEGGEQHHRQVAAIDAGLDALAEIVTGHARHHDVGDHHVDGGIDPGERAFGVVGDQHIVAAFFQDATQAFGLGGAVLNDQNLRHAGTPSIDGGPASSRAMAPSGRTRSTNPFSMATFGMPKTVDVSRSCAMTVPPSSRTSGKPATPSRPMPVSMIAVNCEPNALAAASNRNVADGRKPSMGGALDSITVLRDDTPRCRLSGAI